MLTVTKASARKSAVRLWLGLALLALLPAGCARFSAADPLLEKPPSKLTIAEMGRMVAVVRTNYGKFVIELHPEWAPLATRNFITLIRSGYYDGLSVCEIRPGVWIRGGEPKGDCLGGPGYLVPLERPSAPVVRGAVGLHHFDMRPKTGSSQIFIMLTDAPNMTGSYTIFGKVIEGMAAVDRIGKLSVTSREGVPRPYMPLPSVIFEDMHLEVKR